MNQENKIMISYDYSDKDEYFSLSLVKNILTLNKEILTFKQNEEVRKIKEKELIMIFKNIFLKYKDNIIKYSDFQKKGIDEFSKNKMLIGGTVERIFGTIDNIEVYVQSNFKNDELNDMFKQIYLEINSFVKKIKQAEISNNKRSNESMNDEKLKKLIEELIKKVSGPDPFWQSSIKKYFDNLNKTNEEKVMLLQKLSLEKQVFNDFTKDINSSANPNDIYDKYYKILNSKSNNKFMTNQGEFKQIKDEDLKNMKVETYAEWED